MSIAEKLNSKRVLIFGFGREGRSSYNYIKAHCDCELAVADGAFVDEALLDKDTALFVGADAEDAIESYDIVLKSPGVVFKKEHDISKFSSQTELFVSRYREYIIGVTGTKGKSTTSSLIAHILRERYEDTFLAGNIGVPVLDIADDVDRAIAEGRRPLVVFEMSCHQLQFAKTSPHVAVHLNLFPEHLDHYGTFESYAAAKENIYKFQNENDFVFCGESVGAAELKATQILPYPLEVQTALKGEHNFYNIAVASGVVRLFGLTDEEILRAVASFRPLAHRLEPLGSIDGVYYYNDSISTIPQTAIEGIKALGEVHTLILGGMDRGVSYAELVKYLCAHPVPLVVLMPDTGTKIGMGLAMKGFGGEAVRAQDLSQAVALAKAKTPKGKTVLFSPAAASYGFFKNFEERGEVFCRLVKEGS